MAYKSSYNSKHNIRPRRRRRKLRWNRIILTFGIFAGCICMAVSAFSSNGESDAADVAEETIENALETSGITHLFDNGENPYDEHLPSMPDDGCIKLKTLPIGGSHGKIFNDNNALHLEAATAIGIDPIYDISSAWNLKRPIVEIKSCEDFYVDELHHSYPYLVPEAATLLHDIGRTFNDTLQARGGGSYRLKVTSILRTPLTVGKLRRVNRNATEMSAHQYGTTFDISYSKFICDSLTVGRTQEDLKNLLGEVLFALRDQGRCYIKHERKQACFHITTRN